LIDAQEDERKRVARELHDEMGQSLSGLALQVGAAQRLLASNPQRAGEQLEQVRNLVQEASDQMHDMILALRPSILDDLGLAAALHSQAGRLFEHTSIRFTLDTSQLQGRLPPEIETTLYRVFQEALNNSLRHSNASQVRMVLAKKETAFEGQFSDDGQGFDPDQITDDAGTGRGLGLLGMQERVAQCGGHLEIHSTPGSGTSLFIYIPLDNSHD
jgi:two-component system, NarL family, sensor histidine kinase UhpB